MNRKQIPLAYALLFSLATPSMAQSPRGPIGLTLPNGTLSLFWTTTKQSGTTTITVSTRTVTYPGNKTAITVPAIEATTSPSTTYGGVLSINWLAQLTIPVTNGIMPQGAVSYQFDQYQICSASAWSQFAQANVTASSDQQLTSADASESGVNRFPDVDDPAAVKASVGDSWTMPVLVVEGAVWMSPLQTVLTTTDTSSTNVTPNGGSGSGTSASAKTFTSINFNQSGAKGVGGNSIHITSGDGSPS